MRIINPIYDVAFKYLMEDVEIARKLIGEIIGEKIHKLTVQPQEFTSKLAKHGILIFRLDFKATIQSSTGEYKTVLIELQKAKMYDDLIRFRRYLGENYSNKVEIETSEGIIEQRTLPILTIYFLGFPLEKIDTSILKINREYVDLVSGAKLNVQEEFVEKLTHDSYIILIPKLPEKERTELEGILKIFNQDYQLDTDSRLMEVNEAEFSDNGLIRAMLARLREGATDEVVLRRMKIEEEVESTIDQHIREKQDLKERLNNAIKSKDEAIKSKDDELAEQQKLIEELKKQLKNRKE